MKRLRNIIRLAEQMGMGDAYLSHDEYYGTHVIVETDGPARVNDIDHLCDVFDARVKIEGETRTGTYKYRYA